MNEGIVLSGIQPTGELHIGNYFGAISNWVRLQESHRCYFTVVDLHAMTMPFEPAQLRQQTEQMVIDLLACGIDPDRSLLFIQSLVPEHSELCWILGCICPYGDLTRQTQFRDKAEQGSGQSAERFVSAGLFIYPLLQAADILLYRAAQVPVGKDQLQHLELARDIARRFNGRFGPLFPEPQPLLTETPKIHSLADPQRKMSKQFGPRHYISLFEDEDGIRTKVRGAVTDVGDLPPGAPMSEGVANLFAILNACGREEEEARLRKEYEAGGRRYSHLKDAVTQALVEFIAPLRRRRAEIMAERETMLRSVRKMSEKARDTARETMREVRRLAGLPPRE